jgi:hypothetical protein
MRFCAASQLRCRTIVLSALLFLACELFRSSAQRVDFIDTLSGVKIKDKKFINFP